MIELILCFNKLIETYDGECNGQKLEENYLLSKNGSEPFPATSREHAEGLTP